RVYLQIMGWVTNVSIAKTEV
ncbi:hypothetical protein PPOP_3724, partial [Paenibacillus popilliae ATCC 14706]